MGSDRSGADPGAYEGSPGGSRIELAGVTLGYVGKRGVTQVVLQGGDLSVEPGEIVTVVGPSGCGKTTLLKAIGGLVPVLDGHGTIDGVDMYSSVHHRATVFQADSLLPWRTVAQNVEFGLVIKRSGSPAERRERAEEVLRLVELQEVAELYPWQLSGGMRQRVNLARALAVRPRLLLLDEPFSALDAETRATLQNAFLRLAADQGLTAVFVTHDVEEAVYLGGRVLALGPGAAGFRADLPIRLDRPREPSMRYSRDFGEYVAEVRSHISTR